MNGARWNHHISYSKNPNFFYVDPPKIIDQKKFRSLPNYELNYELRMKREGRNHGSHIFDMEATIPYYLRKKNRKSVRDQETKMSVERLHRAAFHVGPAPPKRHKKKRFEKYQNPILPKLNRKAGLATKRAERNDFLYRQEEAALRRMQNLRKHHELHTTIKHGGNPRAPAGSRARKQRNGYNSARQVRRGGRRRHRRNSDPSAQYRNEGFDNPANFTGLADYAPPDTKSNNPNEQPGFNTQLELNTPIVDPALLAQEEEAKRMAQIAGEGEPEGEEEEGEEEEEDEEEEDEEEA